jgi:transcriptional regulator with XRE-family HTH domain
MPRAIRHDKQTGVEVTAVAIKHDLIAILAARGLSRAECARRIRISSRQFERIVAGGVPKLDTAIALEAVLDTPLRDIFIAKVSIRSAR